MYRAGSILWLLTACSGGQSGQQMAGSFARHPHAVFPNAELLADDGTVRLPPDLPFAETPIREDALHWRHGFSPVQTTVVRPHASIDPAFLPTLDDLDTAGTVQLWDLTTGQRLPCWAELDAWPENPETPSLLIRPAVPFTVGHRIAAVVSADLTTLDGAPLGQADWYRALLSGDPPLGLMDRVSHYQVLDETLERLGAAPRALAVDFPIDDPTQTITDLLSVDPGPLDYTIESFLEAEVNTLPAQTWRRLEGTFTTPNWLVDDVMFSRDKDGAPVQHGTTEAELYVHIPSTLRATPVGPSPVWVFGHGIFASPSAYMNLEDDPSGLLELADRAGAIVVATTWRGLTSSDLLTPVDVGNDFGRIPELTDKLAQGVANTATLVRLVTEGDLLEHPAFEGRADPNDVRYYGISLGAIEGAVLLANTDALPHAVLHVGGAVWSTMLERSSNWIQFEPLVVDSIQSPADRQLLYAISQLYWDPVDPANYAQGLRDGSILWQASLEDEQVSNETTRLLARAVGAAELIPSPAPTWGLDEASAPTSGPVLSWFDPEAPATPRSNRPAPTTGAHIAPRLWEGSKRQTLRFLDLNDPGVVEHYCGESHCSDSNPGDPEP